MTYVRLTNQRKNGARPLAHEHVVKIDRACPVLGNAHRASEMLRSEAVAKHREDLQKDIKANGPMSRKLKGIAEKVSAGTPVALDCWCFPRQCHGDNYVEHLEYLLGRKLTIVEEEATSPGSAVTQQELF